MLSRREPSLECSKPIRPDWVPTIRGRSRPARGPWMPAAGIGLALLAGACDASAQEALQASLADTDSAQARRQAIINLGRQNLKLGPVRLRFEAGLGTEFNSNVNNRNENPESDLIFRPSVRTRAAWPVSDKNLLYLDVGVGYSAYVSNTELSRYYLEPGTELSFDLFIKDLVINFHDRPSLSQYAYTDPTVSGTGDYAQFENTVGASVLWDLNEAQLKVGYDHVNYWELTSAGNRGDGSTELTYLSAGLEVQPELWTGIDLGASWISYDSGQYPDAFQGSVGGFARYIVSDLMNVRLNAGYVTYSPDNSGAFAGLEDTGTWYAQLALNHRVNQYVSYVLSAQQGFSVSFYGGTYETYGAALTPNWHVLRKITLSTPLTYEHSTGVTGSEPEFDYYGAGLIASRPLMERLNASAYVNGYVKDSALATASYTVWVVGVGLRYAF